MSIVSNIISGGVGLAIGEEVADSFVDDDNILGHVVVGGLTAGVGAGLTKSVLKETGIDDVLDDIFGF